MEDISARRLAQHIRKALITKMRLESPLRNKLQVVFLATNETHVEMPVFPCKRAICFGEDGKDIQTIDAEEKLGGILVPMFEVSSCPTIPEKDIQTISSVKDIVRIFEEKSKDIIEYEKELYEKIMKSAGNGRGWLLIRTDLTVLPACSGGNVAFSIFENIGVAIEPEG